MTEVPTATAAAPLVTVGLCKRFQQGARTIEALAGLDLRVSRGEFVAVMGASGSGKSTLLHVAAGLTPADAGQVLIDGQDLAGCSDQQLTTFRRRRIGLVFQSYNLIPSLTVEENVALPLRADGRGQEVATRVPALLEQVGLSDRRTHRPDALSGGEQQRVAIARALVTEPALVLADEPTGSLDSVTGQQVCALLESLCREQGRTIVVVTHEPAVAAWASRVVVLKDGRLLTELELPARPAGEARPRGDAAQELAVRYHAAVSASAVAV